MNESDVIPSLMYLNTMRCPVRIEYEEYGLFLRQICTKTRIFDQVLSRMKKEFTYYHEMFDIIKTIGFAENTCLRFNKLAPIDLCDLMAIYNSFYRKNQLKYN